MNVAEQNMASMAALYALPTIAKLREAGVAQGEGFYIVIAKRTGFGDNFETLHTVESCNEVEWEYPYNEIAVAKTRLSARTGLSTREVLHHRPELLVTGDVMYYGNVIRDPFIVSCSGFQEWMDEAIAGIIMDILMGITQNSVEYELSKKNGFLFRF